MNKIIDKIKKALKPKNGIVDTDNYKLLALRLALREITADALRNIEKIQKGIEAKEIWVNDALRNIETIKKEIGVKK